MYVNVSKYADILIYQSKISALLMLLHIILPNFMKHIKIITGRNVFNFWSDIMFSIDAKTQL